MKSEYFQGVTLLLTQHEINHLLEEIAPINASSKPHLYELWLELLEFKEYKKDE